MSVNSLAVAHRGTQYVEGGYVPLADGRARADIPYENYAYYRQLLAEISA
ncbi:MAG: hypothetical protein KKD28_02180 [Chloroflexi bacterium]|nr:hypothetical protein [Chloroflexota bacterium]MBU1660263.1 hypothetical protein [Chloroflexota bacterium]